MDWQYTPYVVPAIVASGMSAVLAFIAWQRRSAVGAAPLAWVMLAVTIWSLSSALSLGFRTFAAITFWAKFTYVGIAALPVAWLAFVLEFSGHRRWLNRRNLLLLAVIPLITLLLVGTDEQHGLFYSAVQLDTSGALPMLEVAYGPWFHVHAIYSYLLFLLGLILLVQKYRRASELYRRQTAIALAGAMAPFVASVLDTGGWNPFRYLALTPFGFVLMGFVLMWGVFRFRLLDIRPIAHDMVIEGMSDGLIVLDAQGRIVELNPAARRILGQEAMEMIGQPAVEALSPWPILVAHCRETTESEAEIAISIGETQSSYDLRASPLCTQRGVLTGRLLVLRDVTARIEAEEERRALIAKLEAKNAELERFTYTVSHDLKSPLITVRGFLGFLEQAALAGNIEQIETDMARITEATDTMYQLLDELLELSRIGRQMNPPEEIPLGELAREAVNLVSGRLEEQGVEVKIAPDLPVICGDRPRLRQVLQNLVDNAVKFMGDQPAPRVEIGMRRADGEHVLFVRDNGIGIAPRHQEQVFDLFQKLDSRGEGTGVGLATVKRIVELHGGRIWVESEGEGKGSTFCFTLQGMERSKSSQRRTKCTSESGSA